MTIFLPLLDDIEDLHRVVDVPLRDALHIHHLVLSVLMDLQFSLFCTFFWGTEMYVHYMAFEKNLSITGKEVADRFQVELKVRDLDYESVLVVLYVGDMVKDVVNNSRDDPHHLLAVDVALHGVRLAWRGLAIGKYSPIVTTQNI